VAPVIATSRALGLTSNVAAAVGSAVVVEAGADVVVEAVEEGDAVVGAAELPPELHAAATSAVAARIAERVSRRFEPCFILATLGESRQVRKIRGHATRGSNAPK